MKKNYFVAVLLIAFLSFTSCSSDDSSSNGTAEVSSESYWPLAVNNQWVYNENGSLAAPVKITGTEKFDGVVYYKTSEKNEYNLQSWVAKKDRTYYLKIGALDITESGINIKMNSYELPVFKDNLAINEQWSGTTAVKVTYIVSGQSVSANMEIKYVGTILDKNASLTINDKVYTNIIKSRYRQDVIIQGQSTVTETLYWYAKGIGPIKVVHTADGQVTEQIIIDYVIN
ncbi:hypothetical protein [Flavobacterium frigoris]|uniref:Lipoprotein n=1 Tax=Flavobacterium frigoris TaxID=229204 RepID=A0A1H9CX55_FLAFI|nr:hypothetical protein [Flavobacterium frigoris]SEQ05719.1 hypothetical protein SAMN05444355_101298 [Flavobacterium frigoris]